MAIFGAKMERDAILGVCKADRVNKHHLPFVGVAGLLAVSLTAIPLSRGQGAAPPAPADVLRKKSYVGPVPVGGLDRAAAEKAVRVWWETEKGKKLKLATPGGKVFDERTLPALGLAVDDAASVAALPADGTELPVADPEGFTRAPVLFKRTTADRADLAKAVRKALPQARPDRVTYEKGAILRKAGTPRLELDESRLPSAVLNAWRGDRPVTVPVAPGPLAALDLSKITDVVATFTTTYSPGNRLRTRNVKLAADKLDGVVLGPGDILSFNETVGERTREAGYQDAVIFVEGRHEPGLAGGICQVSSTLYNAALLGDLAIVRRQNHSLPVPYVPMGRDATVLWGLLDLKLRNDAPDPVALSVQMGRGRLTMRVLGRKVPGKEVEVGVGRRIRLPDGGTRVTAWRIVKKDGKVARREDLGTSRYMLEKKD